MPETEIPLFKVLMAPGVGQCVTEVLHSGHIAQGPMVDQLEQLLAERLEVPAERIVTVNSGTSALHLAYHVAGVTDGSPVLVSPMTCAATITPLMHLMATPTWVDVDPVTGLIDPASVQLHDWKGCPATAVVAIDWAGTPCDYDALRAVVPRHVPIIEDAAHAFMARRRDGRSIATAAADDNIFVAYSAQAIKTWTMGDGGVLVCPTVRAAERARKLRWFGFDRRSSADFRCAQNLEEAGYKFHLNDLAATIGIANLGLAVKAVSRHRQNAYDYFKMLSGLPRVTVPPWPGTTYETGSSYWIYTILVDDRESFQAFMKERGIATSQVHRRNDEHTAFPQSLPGSLPGLDQFAARQVSIPVGWWLSEGDVKRVITAVTDWSKTEPTKESA